MTEKEGLRIPTDTLRVMSFDLKNSATSILNGYKSGLYGFDSANLQMTSAVVAPSQFLLCVDIGKYGRETDIEETFKSFCLKVGNLFKDKKRNTPEYKKALGGVGQIVKEYLPIMLKKLQIDVDVYTAIDKIDVLNLKEILAPDYGIDMRPEETLDEFKQSLLRSVDHNDTFANEVDKLEKSGKGNLTNNEIACIKVGIALAQAGYLQSQLFRAIEEDEPGKIGRLERDVFDINPNMRQRVFMKTMGSMEDKLNRLTFEVYKDVLQFKK